MRHVAAYLLLALGSNTEPTTKDIKALLSSVGIESLDDRADVVVKSLKGKPLDQLIREGTEKLAGFSVGAGGAGAGGRGDAACTQMAAPKAESKAPEQKKVTPEPESDSDEDMGLGLFD